MISSADTKCRIVLAAGVALLCALLLSSVCSADDLREIYRIRVANEVDGPVQVSLDQGKTYATVGRVTCPAANCGHGFAASRYAQAGRVAAVAVHAIRVKVRDGDSPQVFSIIPREFTKPGGDFGTGEIAGTSGIYTDIPTGTSIFRNLSPLVGNPVYLEMYGNLRPIPKNYVPSTGNTIVIVVQMHERYPSEIVIENKRGGKVEAVYADTSETIAVVERPVVGVGRFDATEYTGVGCINTNHTGVVTVSTAPVMKGKGGPEPRGGFQILPSKHAAHIGWIPQYLVVAPPSIDAAALEGSPMLFSGYIGLTYDASSPANSYRVDVRVSGSEWRPLQALLGKRDDALVDFVGTGQPVTHIRLRFPERSDEWLQKQFKAASDSYVRARYAGKPPAYGVLDFSLAGSNVQGAKFASFYVDREFRGISSSAPYRFSVDTGKLPVGEHCVEIRACNEAGAVVKSSKQWFYTAASSSRRP